MRKGLVSVSSQQGGVAIAIRAESLSCISVLSPENARQLADELLKIAAHVEKSSLRPKRFRKNIVRGNFAKSKP